MSGERREHILAAIDTLETSYSYEANRWMNPYRELRTLEGQFYQQLKRYSWIFYLFGASGLVCYVATIFWSFSAIGGNPAFIENALLNSLVSSTLWVAPATLIGFGSWLMLQVAAHRHPLLLLKSRVERATRRFRALAGEPLLEENA